MQIRCVALPSLLVLAMSSSVCGGDELPNRRGILLHPRIVRVSFDTFDADFSRLGPKTPSRLLSDIEAFFIIEASMRGENFVAANRTVFPNGKRTKIRGGGTDTDGTYISFALFVRPVIADDGSSFVLSVEPVENTLSVPTPIKSTVKTGHSLLVFIRTDDENGLVECIIFSPRIGPPPAEMRTLPSPIPKAPIPKVSCNKVRRQRAAYRFRCLRHGRRFD